MELTPLLLVAGAVLLEIVASDYREEVLKDLAEHLVRAEVSKRLQLVGGLLAIILQVVLTVGAALLFTLPVVEAIGGQITLFLASALTYFLVMGRRWTITIKQLPAAHPLAQIGFALRIAVVSDLPAILAIGILCAGNGWAACLGMTVGRVLVLMRFFAPPSINHRSWLSYLALPLLVWLSAWAPFQDRLIRFLLSLGSHMIPISWLSLFLGGIFALLLLLLALTFKFSLWRNEVVVRCFTLAFVILCGVALLCLIIGIILSVSTADPGGSFSIMGPVPLRTGIFMRSLLALGWGYFILVFASMLIGFWMILAHQSMNVAASADQTTSDSRSSSPSFRTSRDLVAGIFALLGLGGVPLLAFVLFLPSILAFQDPYLIVLNQRAFQQHSIVLVPSQDTLQVARDILIKQDDTVSFENDTREVQRICVGNTQDCTSRVPCLRVLQAPGLRIPPGQTVDVTFSTSGVYHLTSRSTGWLDLTVQVNPPDSDNGN